MRDVKLDWFSMLIKLRDFKIKGVVVLMTNSKIDRIAYMVETSPVFIYTKDPIIFSFIQQNIKRLTDNFDFDYASPDKLMFRLLINVNEKKWALKRPGLNLIKEGNLPI